VTGLANDETDTLLRAILRDVLGLAADRVAAFDADTGLFGALPELDRWPWPACSPKWKTASTS
jgi:hypothetical protein